MNISVPPGLSLIGVFVADGDDLISGLFRDVPASRTRVRSGLVCGHTLLSAAINPKQHAKHMSHFKWPPAEFEEGAFAQMVERNTNFVFSTALRELENRSMAEDVTQGVFIILARKRPRFSSEAALLGWLFKTTRYVASDLRKKEGRRRWREFKALQLMTTENEAADSLWERVGPLVNDALGSLKERDRLPLLLRIFEGKSYPCVAGALGINEAAARQRVSRSIEKLRAYIAKRGVALPLATLAVLLASHGMQAASSGLAALAIQNSVSLAGPASSVVAGLVNGHLRLLNLFRLKTAALTYGGIIILFSATAFLFEYVDGLRVSRPVQTAEETGDTDGLLQKNASDRRSGDFAHALQEMLRYARKNQGKLPSDLALLARSLSDPILTRLVVEGAKLNPYNLTTIQDPWKTVLLQDTRSQAYNLRGFAFADYATGDFKVMVRSEPGQPAEKAMTGYLPIFKDAPLKEATSGN